MDDDENNHEYINHYLKLDEEYIDKYGDKVALFYQLGGFYQLYGTKERMKKICYDQMGISFRRIKDTHVYTGGYPINSLKKYTKELINSNYIVVVYDQEQDGGVKKSKGKTRVFKQIISGATDIEDDDTCIDNHIILCLYIEFDKHVIDNVEICTYESSTGKSICYINNNKTYHNMISYVEKIDPKQIVIYTDGCIDDPSELAHKLKFTNQLYHLRLNLVPSDYKKIQFQNLFLSDIFPSKMLSAIEYIGLGKYPSTIICYVLLLKFINEFNPSFLLCLSPPHIKTNNNVVILSENCIEQLNLIDKHRYSLFNIINNTSTIGGKGYLKQLLLNPSTDLNTINKSYQHIELMIPVYQEFENVLNHILNIEKLHRKIHINTLNPCECQYLEQSYDHIIKLMHLSKKYNIHDLHDDIINQCQAFYTYLTTKIIMTNAFHMDDDYIKPLFNRNQYVDLDVLYDNNNQLHQKLDELAKIYANAVGKSEPLKLDISKGTKTLASGIYQYHITEAQRKILQKLYPNLEFTGKSSGYKMSSLEIRQISEKIVESQHQINLLTKNYYLQMLNELSTTYNTLFHDIVHYVNIIDVIKSNAKTAVEEKYCKPIIKNVDKSFINAKQLRHPIVEKVNTNVQFIPNDCHLGDDVDGLLCFSVNGAGKSTFCRSVGIGVFMAQAGMYVAAESFVYGIYKKIGIKMIGGDDIYAEKSLFINEVLKMKEFMTFADPSALIIGDELSNGTEYPSQVGLIAALVKYLSNSRASFILMSHLHDLIHLDIIKLCKNVKINHIAVTIEQHKMIYERQLKDGPSPNLYGIEIASFLGLDPGYIQDAYQVRDIILNKNKNTEFKQSHFNADVVMTHCAICQTTKNLITHHITHQAEFKKMNQIPFDKNVKHNLVVLCEKCHEDIHSNKRKIYGYRQTSDGVELQFE
ncbi:MAG TPA: hypothetical protein VLG50_07990 [Candidatus Saccharimonadales bacterium]|nr:hypothetical protein [Candidatus Saccharimonadales bacterium]